MVFDAQRLHPTLLDQARFGARWRTLDELALRAVDPNDVGVRLALYRSLIERTNPRGAMGAHDELHPLWGYVAQLAWQQRSGRLGRGDDIIVGQSWWGGMNYALSVVPYWAAMQEGVVPALSLPEPPLKFSRAIIEWRRVVQMMMAYVGDADLEPLRREVWRAHLMSIDAGEREHVSRRLMLPMLERRFSLGWTRMVELFAAAAWRTDLPRVIALGDTLPSRVLVDDATLAALPKAERATARQVIELGDRAPWRWAVEVGLWKRTMRERPERDDAPALLAALFGRGDSVWSQRLRALKATVASEPRGPKPRGDVQ